MDIHGFTTKMIAPLTCQLSVNGRDFKQYFSNQY